MLGEGCDPARGHVMTQHDTTWENRTLLSDINVAELPFAVHCVVQDG